MRAMDADSDADWFEYVHDVCVVWAFEGFAGAGVLLAIVASWGVAFLSTVCRCRRIG